MSGDPEQEYFADGIVEDIITALSRISQMRVIARNSTFAYKGQAIDLRRVAGELGVRYVLEGSVRSVGTRLRITAQLIAAEDGSHLWAERFDRSVDDIFEIQDEITKEIVTALRVNLTDGEVASVISHGTKNVEAWQLCFEATELFMRFSASDYLQARALAERALKLDPNFSYAWATLGFTYWWDGRLGYTGDTKEKFARADEYARKAMSIDSTVSWAIGLSAMVAAPIGRHQEGIDIARRGVDLYPGNADVRAFLGFALLHAGQLAEAVEHIRAAMDFNPFYPNWYLGGLQSALRGLGDLEGVLSIANEVLEKEPGFLGSWLARAYVYQKTGRRSDALAAIREVQKLAPNLRVEHLPNMTLINDKAITKDYSTVLREAGLPE
jgi:adenylate cyclase